MEAIFWNSSIPDLLSHSTYILPQVPLAKQLVGKNQRISSKYHKSFGHAL